MSVRRRFNWINQGRVDVPDLKSVESAVSNDFDELLSSLVLGESESYVLRGFELSMSGAIGSAASSLQMIVEEGSILHGKSDESGTFFVVPSGTANETLNSTTNERVEGAFTPSALNYVGLEFTREIDDATTGQRFLWNPTTDNEINKTAPLAVTFDYKVVVTSSIFASNVLPIAIVETDAANNVIRVEDRRPMLFRLGTAGSSTPNPFYEYPWTDGRDENFYSSTTQTSPFQGGDKQITTLKEMLDAFMTEFKQMKGTTYWYSDASAGSIYKLRADAIHTQITGSGKISHSETTAGQLNWDLDIFLDFVGSRLSYKIAANPATTDLVLADNQVAYIKLVRDVDITPKLIFTQSSAVVTSVGAVSWTNDILAGDWIKIKTADDTKYYQVDTIDSASQVTLTEVYLESSTGSDGTEAQYAFGEYQTDPAPSTDRHIKIADRKDVPFEQDTYWLWMRNDNGGATAKVYMRGMSGGEIEQGEDRQISDNTTLEVLEYMGSPSETDTTPDYTNAIATYATEITQLTFGPANAMSSGESFNMNSASNLKKFAFWANIDGAGGNPNIAGRIMQEVALASTDNAIQVATKYHGVINALGEFNSTDNLDGSLTVETSQVGEADNATNNDTTGLSIVVSQEGVGKANCAVVDDENLTRGIKRLDEAICDILSQLADSGYREKLRVVVGAPADDNEITGPLSVGSTLTLPLNSLDSNVQQEYVVGSKILAIFLNGDKLCEGNDYDEDGAVDSLSTTVTLQRPAEVGDVFEFTFDEGAGGASGGGSASGVNLGPSADADVFKQTVGTQLQFRRLTAGSGVTIVEGAEDISISSTPTVADKNVVKVNADHVIQPDENVILVENSGSDVTITLPSATSSGKEISIKKIDSGNTMNIKTIGGQNIDGVDRDATPLPVTIQYESITLIADGTEWWII